VIWKPESIQFTLDGAVYATYTPADMMPGMVWPFDDGPMCVRLSLAVGGAWPGPPSPQAYPLTMLVNWVQVWA
jgi:beta-glucanase (GH16 family)